VKVKVKKQRVTVYCQCGASMTGWVSPPGVADPLKAAWTSVHRGEAHGPATRTEAQAVRRRQDRKESPDA
jgi:hypothetical protein